MENLPISNAVLSFLQKQEIPSFESVSDYTRSIITKMENGLILTDKGVKYSEQTIRIYNAFLKYFDLFQEQFGREILFNDLSPNFGEVFKSFLAEKNLAMNSITAYTKKLKSILSFANKDGISVWNGSGVKTPSEKTPKIYLSLSELKLINKAELSAGQSIVRDIFLVQCFTGFRFDTLMKFLKSPIAYVKEYEGSSYIDIIADKTNEQCVIPLGKTVIEIIKKYDGQIPIKSGRHVNEEIKIIGRISGINSIIPTRITRAGVMVEELVPKYSQISTHTARRTFISLLSQQKEVSKNEIMAMSGHKSESQLSTYARTKKFEIILPILNNKFFNTEI